MNSISDILPNSNSYSHRSINNKQSIAIDSREIDAILNSYPELIKPEYRGWFVKRLKAIGKDDFVDKAEKSLKYGRNPTWYFISLLN